MDKQGRMNTIAAQKGPIEYELLAAEVQLDTKTEGVKHKATGVTQDQVESAKALVDGLKAQIKVIEDHLAEVAKEPDDE